MPIDYITHKGKKILHVNLKDVKDKESVLEHLDLMAKFYLESDGNILLLADLTNTFTNPEVMDKLKHYGKTVFTGRSKKRAVVGMTGMKKILMNAYNMFTKNEVVPFNTEEEAKDYLVS
jgi:hypothetical protein